MRINGKNAVLKTPGVCLRALGAGLMLGLAGASALAAEEIVTTRGSAQYVSGGVGDESMQRMTALAKDFNLQLLFAATAGNYLADVAVSIRDARGAVVLETSTDGPLLLARLPAGRYEFAASLDGVSVRQTATVAATGQRRLVFRWNVPVD